MIPQKQTYVLLHNIRSVHNTGSIFRTADCAGVCAIFLSGHTPAPLDRFKRTRSDFAKVALGAENSVPWEYIEHAQDAIKKFKEKTGGIVVAVEQHADSIDYREFAEKIKSEKNTKAQKPILLIFGNEVGGVEPELLKLADMIIEIPQFGTKESLNVSVTAGIILFSLT